MVPQSPYVSRRTALLGMGAGALALSPWASDIVSAAPSNALLRLGFAGGGTTDRLDPHAHVGLASGAVVQSVFEQITQVGPDFKLSNVLAEDITSNARLDQWDVRLRKGVEFHNGKTLTAGDLIFSVRRILDPKSPGYAAGQIAFVDLEGMTALDERTVRFNLKKPFAFFALAFGDGGVLGVVPEGFTRETPMGTGPYKVASFTPGQQIVLERHANYWGPRPPVERIIALNFKDDFARVNALVSGQIDAMNQVPLSMLKMLEGHGRIRTQLSKTGLFNPFSMRTDEGPLADNRIRQAFRLMLDREQVVKQAFGGNATICSDLYSPFDADFDSSLVRGQDLDQARSLLKQAGASELSITLLVAPVRYGMVEAAQVIANQAAAIGVKINLRKLEAAAARSAEVQSAPFTFGLFPGLSYMTMAAISDGPYSTLNTSRFADPEFKALFDQTSSEPNAAIRTELIRKMQRIQFDRGGYLYPAFPMAADAFHDSVKGIAPDGSGLGLGRAQFGKLSVA